MTLTTNGKNYIARELGISNCFATTGLSWTAVAVDGTTVNETGGTASIVGRLVSTSVYSKINLTSPRIKTYYYSDLRVANDNTEVTLADAQWIAANTYCAPAVTPTPSPTPTPTPKPTPAPGVAGVFDFQSFPTGLPTVTLDLSALIMRQASDYHFEMNDIVIKNTSSWPVYLAMEIKLFSGALASCPPSGYVFDGMDRTATKNVRVKTLAPGESGTYDTDFYQPLSIIGVHTVCLLVHGAWTKAEIDSEVLPITG